MGNICCGCDEEAHRHGAWCGPDDDADVEAEHESHPFDGGDDERYDANATNREQLIRLREETTGGRRRREHRASIRCTPVDLPSSFSLDAIAVPKSPETTAFLVNALAGNFVFDCIDDKAKLQFVSVMQPQEFNEGDWVMRQGDVGDYFYILEEGEVAFCVAGAGDAAAAADPRAQDPGDDGLAAPRVGTGARGTTFGELALLYNTPRAASVRALTPLRLYKIDQRTFRALLLSRQRADRSHVIALVEKMSAFEKLHPTKLRKLVDAFTIINAIEGQRIVNKGDVGNVFYIVMSGAVKVDDIGHGSSKFEDQILEAGGSFGERALITGETRAANVTAVMETSLLAISKSALEEIIGPLEEACKMSSYSEYLSSIPLFEHLEPDEIDRCVSHLKRETFNEGDKIDARGGKLYLIEEGRALTTIGNTSEHEKKKGKSRGSILVKLEKGDYFGRLADRDDGEEHENSITSQGEATTEYGNRYLIIVETHMVCRTLRNTDVERIIGGNLHRHSASCADPAAEEEEASQVSMLKLISGSVRRLAASNADSTDEEEKKARITRLRHKWRQTSSRHLIQTKKSNAKRRVLNLSKLKKHSIIGMGAFGKVWLVTSNSNEKGKPTCYALKMISKREVLQQNLAASVLREKNVMESVEHPFLIRMTSSLQDENYLYFVLDLVLGGELFELLYGDRKKLHNVNPAWKESEFYKSFGEQDNRPIKGLTGVGCRSAVFYSACVIEAFNHLHNRRIVYRDLKPENVLLNRNGYCLVVDMGFSKVVLDKTYTLCGTLEYLAPEVIANIGHNHAADYWSFACLLYELIVGHTPFYEANLDQISMLKKIVKAHYSFPEIIADLSPQSSNGLDEALCSWKDIVSRLLKPRNEERLGNLQHGIDDILDHGWFANIDRPALLKQTIPAPWVPPVMDPMDTSRFKNKFRGLEKQKETFKRKLTAKEQEVFRSF